ncbi:TetR/AcrR family transcriptional regulator [Streptomyces qinglanensis]|uniref:DNA-binding transcriptional regulator YbjK n=1 Tax=Streptomyces qinglanensis TaxID=943816 RepID=A0A1H9W1M3_9ACTN|nr:TetR/AcrR family transcriptional regulator [Streptomyces qinglanensis]SES27671.1 DNA-binding transcriptional regulator YbjK [Streptomyces qinglanensis]
MPPPPPTAADRGREVRQRLLRAATELIAERGWSAVSTRGVAERAEVGQGLVHYHFASLDALLQQAALGTVEEFVREFTALMESAVSTEEALDSALGSLDGFSGTDPISLLFTETYLAAARDEELMRALAGLLTRVRDGLAGRLSDSGVPQPQETAAVLLAVVDGLMLHRPASPSLTSAAVGPVLRRLLTTTTPGSETP